MNKYRIVQFNNGKYALQRVVHLFWCIPIPLNLYKDLRCSKFNWSMSSAYFNTECVTNNLDELKKLHTDWNISRVITETKLEKVLK